MSAPVHVSETLDTIHATALSLARKWNLVCADGSIVCLRESCGLTATLPSLLCPGHLAARQGKGVR